MSSEPHESAEQVSDEVSDASGAVEFESSSPEAHRAAKILYRPVGIASSIVGGMVAARVFRLVYKKASPGDSDDPPTALQSEYSMRQVLVGAALQGAIYAVVKATIDRAGARAFQRWTGEWPGD